MREMITRKKVDIWYIIDWHKPLYKLPSEIRIHRILRINTVKIIEIRKKMER